MLGLPALGIAFAYTTVTTYVPVLLEGFAGPAVTGALIGGEGLLALVIPVVVGGWSEGVRSDRFGRLGGRAPFILVGALVAAAALVTLAIGSESMVAVSCALGIFFVAYFVYYAPYYALYPDLVPNEISGRSQGFQGALRSGGLLLGLAGSGFLLSLWQPLPFVIAAIGIPAVTLGLYLGVRGRAAAAATPSKRENGFHAIAALVRNDPAIRRWAIANICWEAAIAALRTFVVLYFTKGLGLSIRHAAMALALVGAAALVAAPIAGKAGDRYGPRPIMMIAVCAFAIGLTPTLFTTSLAYITAIIPIAFAAVVLMTLPYALLMDLLPDTDKHGAGAGLFGLSRGIGVIIGPTLAGAATAILQATPTLTFAETNGYSAAFAVAALLLAASTPYLRRPATHPS